MKDLKWKKMVAPSLGAAHGLVTFNQTFLSFRNVSNIEKKKQAKREYESQSSVHCPCAHPADGGAREESSREPHRRRACGQREGEGVEAAEKLGLEDQEGVGKGESVENNNRNGNKQSNNKCSFNNR